MNSAAPIRVSEDFAGLRRAALELLEEERTRPERERLKRVAEGAANAEALRAAASACGGRTLAPGYYRRVVEYLVWLERVVPLCGIGSRDLLPSDLTGLDALAAARADFEKQHPPCPQCGGPLENPAALSCRCGWRKKTA